ncbi:MAG: hypothetical protein P8Y13_03765 [Deinococcales bacterium]
MDTQSNSQRGNRSPQRRGLVARLGLGAVLALGLLAAAAPMASATSLPNGSNVKTFTLVEKDYSFTPNHMTWKVGETVRITLKNEAKTNTTHEFMMGKNLKTCTSSFGSSYPCGWKQPLIASDTNVVWGQGKGIADLQVDEPAHAALNQGGSVTMQFKVPDKPGTWQFACFEQKGEHYKKGMKGTITIKK